MFTSKKALADAIRTQITTNNAQSIKAMLRIYAKQTENEQMVGGTHELNGVGFTGADGEILTSFSRQYLERGFLSPKQMALLQRKIGKYATQLVDLAIANGIYVKVGKEWKIA